MIRVSSRRLVALLSSLALVASGSVGLAASADAMGGETGYLLIHGVGSSFAGTHTSNTIAATAGASVSFAFKVKNTGSSTAQYNLTVDNQRLYCLPNCPLPAISLTSGSLVVTPLSQGPNGYFTPQIAAGQTATFTLKATVPTGTPAGDVFYQTITLKDTAHTELDHVVTAEDVTSSAKGTLAADQFVSGSGGQHAVGDPELVGGYVTDAAIALNGKATYTVKLQNDSIEAQPIGYQLQDPDGCASQYPATVKSGTTDVTAAALAGTYSTPVLAPGKSVSLTVTVSHVALPNWCGDPLRGSDFWLSVSSAGTTTEQVYLITNATTS